MDLRELFCHHAYKYIPPSREGYGYIYRTEYWQCVKCGKMIFKRPSKR